MTSRSPAQAGSLFEPIARKMKHEGIPPLVIEDFRRHYIQLVEGATGLIGRDAIEPLDNAPDLERIGDLAARGRQALGQAVIIKLNGGLGTSMGLERAKSVIEVREGMTFLDIIIRQVLALRESAGVHLPLIFMNSFSTEEDTRAVIARYPHLALGQGRLPFSFLQYKVPKIRQDSFEAVHWPADPALEWCPPGHGEIYTALVTRGVLDALLEDGFRYAFVSNADNLSAVLDLN
ncbi:MAG: UTP--glucose-1-phosphate uridylyltransferase, partial [Kiritimatiellae bacterium]|nr:UTP--glucose-1-phosphate uridylyltransferase [Kiritimatiellia bacterium]